MKCGENIKHEFNERNQLKINTIQMAKKLNIHMQRIKAEKGKGVSKKMRQNIAFQER